MIYFKTDFTWFPTNLHTEKQLEDHDYTAQITLLAGGYKISNCVARFQIV